MPVISTQSCRRLQGDKPNLCGTTLHAYHMQGYHKGLSMSGGSLWHPVVSCLKIGEFMLHPSLREGRFFQFETLYRSHGMGLFINYTPNFKGFHIPPPPLTPNNFGRPLLAENTIFVCFFLRTFSIAKFLSKKL